MSQNSIPAGEPRDMKSSSQGRAVTEQVFSELRRLAELKLRGGPRSASMQATMLVNEAWLRLRETPAFEGRDSGHFLAAAVQAMRWIVVDRAKKRRMARLGTAAGAQLAGPSVEEDDELLALADAMERLKASFPAEAEVAELRYFTGLSIEETAEAMGASPATISRRWSFARAWLTRDLTARESGNS